MVKVQAGRRRIPISHPHKVLMPARGGGISKRELAEYYVTVAPQMLRHLRDRPLALQRFPDGSEAGGFYQKQVPDHFPPWVRRCRVKTSAPEGSQELVCGADKATLAYLADQAAVTLHPWLSRADRLDVPDQLVVDLDPPDGTDTFPRVRQAARRCRELFRELGLDPLIKTTGSRGVHLVVVIRRQLEFDEVRRFARTFATTLARRYPDTLTVEQRKVRRGRRIYLDVGRNAYGQTAVAPYSVRARPDGPVATPIDWDELDDVEPDSYTVRNVLRRLDQRDCPWRHIGRRRASLEAPARRLAALSRAPHD